MPYLVEEEDYLAHIGMPRRSGRYPWGSGENPFQSSEGFLGYYHQLKKKGLTETEIAAAFGLTDYKGEPTTSRLRARVAIANEEVKQGQYTEWQRLREKGWSKKAIAERFNVSETTVANRLNSYEEERKKSIYGTAEMLKDEIKNKKYLDVGYSAELYSDVSRTRLRDAIEVLKEEGYNVYNINTSQVGSSKPLRLKVLTAPEVSFAEAAQNKDKLELAGHDVYSDDGGRTWRGIRPPSSVDSKRVQVRYAEEGGVDKDGVIELRRGLNDLNLGEANYAQVRIAVDGTHYLKGMAIYADDLPDGIDVVFNTNKSKGTPMLGPKDNSVLKPLKSDPDNPFGATVRQKTYMDGDEEKLSPVNIVREEGKWGDWSKTIASQMLSKQPTELAKRQLSLFYDKKQAEYDEICSLTNTAVQKKLLGSFADDCDSASVHLQAAGFPRQSWNVILPLTTIGDKEIYAPHAYRDGEEVALIRFPHAGVFEIPRLIVNNRNREGKRILGDAEDAVGINSKVAQQLSGADFDGDTVLVVPTKGLKLKTSDPLDELQKFDPKVTYKKYDGMRVMTEDEKQMEMGKVSNLITDMTIRNAPVEDIVKAVKHSMVVIDAVKHELNYKQSYKDNEIARLKEEYQGGKDAGASTLISRAKSRTEVPQRTEGKYVTDEETGKTTKLYIDPKTGKKLYTETGDTYTQYRIRDPETHKDISLYKDPKTGKFKYTSTREDFDGDVSKIRSREIVRTQKSTKMAETDDAYTLSSGTLMEGVYADHANQLKNLANEARRRMVNLPGIKRDPTAAQTYSEEVASLKKKVNEAKKNRPLERKAQVVANAIIKMTRDENPEMTPDDVKKLKDRALKEARNRFNSSRRDTDAHITQREWEAIQAGAVSNNFLVELLNNTNVDEIKKYATPRVQKGLTSAQRSRIRTMKAAGVSTIEIADALGVSPSTIDRALKDEA